MLKNVSSESISLLWDGKTTVLLPGQTCRYRDPRIETRMRTKFGKSLLHTPEPKGEAAAQEQVIVDPIESSLPPVAVPDPAAPVVSGPNPVDPLTCSDCGFVAKTGNGLLVHRAKHEK